MDWLLLGMDYGLVALGFLLTMLLTALACATVGGIIGLIMDKTGLIDDGEEDD